jgi:hypothetical protein
MDLATLSITALSDPPVLVPFHPISVLYRKRPDSIECRVERDNQVVWLGALTDAQADLETKVVTLIADSILAQKIRNNGRIDSSEQTPAKAIEQILALHDIPIDAASFAYADSLLDDIPVRVRVEPSLTEWTGSLADILNLLVLAGVGRMYLTRNGTIGFDTWIEPTAPVTSVEITDNDLRGWPTVEVETAEPLDGYSLEWEFGTDSLNVGVGNNIRQMDFGGNSAVIMPTQAAAIYVGEQWIALSRRHYVRVGLRINPDLAIILKLGNYVLLQSEALGMLNQSGEIVGIDDADPRYTVLTVQVDQGEFADEE